ncbi:hypothetical protein KFL_004570030 [Klebsormidium nitens]|uniref:Uncharacterized protein n=1 Tax=Klebsormidium nitens TaxID=105231 RepID=A0A1Y1II58_KLENI|nr:hypothetical protein KFL_004570030 [Klebsormidium nitens]|eukprot:GAQ88761.1 hypothetical protein KFL_004570030 [Klebsormidium nitens]
MEARERSIIVNDPASYHSALAQQSPLLSINEPGQQKADTSQRSLHLPLFGTLRLFEEDFSFQSGVGVHAGGPVWALDWCPEQEEIATSDEARPQFLAVGVHPPNVSNIPSGKAFHGKGTVQIWQIEEAPPAAKAAASRKGKQKIQEGASPKHRVPGKSPEDLAMEAVLPTGASLSFGIAHEGSLVWDLKWRPARPSAFTQSSEETAPHLGQLAAALGNGSVHVWTVPTPASVPRPTGSSVPAEAAGGAKKRKRKGEPAEAQPPAPPVVVSLPSAAFRTGHATLGRRLPLTLEWSPCAPSNLLLAGCHDGTVVLWRVPDTKPSSSDHVFPLACFKAEDTPLRSLAWVPPHVGGSNQLFVTGGHRGAVKFWDVRDPLQPIWTLSVARSWILGLDWLASPRCVTVSRDDGWYQVYTLDGFGVPLPGCQPPVSGSTHAHIRKLSDGALWGADISRLTGLVATGSSSGVVSFFQLTRGWVSTGHGSNRHVQPAYRCAALEAEDDSGPVRLRLSGPNENFATKKEANEALHNNSTEGQPDDADAPGPSKVGATQPSMRKQGKGTSGQGGHWRKQPVKIVGSDPSTSTRSGDNKEAETHFPARKVAVHRVTWNPHKRYGLWMAWGGRAGVVSCQRVRLPQYEALDERT